MAFELPTNFTVGNEITSVSGVGDIFQYASYATEGLFGYGLLFLIFLISFTATAAMNFSRAFVSASFITFVFSIYFVRIDMLSPTIPLYLMVAVIVGFFWAKSERTQSNY